MKIILDTNIYISHYVFSGVCQKVMNKIEINGDNILISKELFFEIKEKFLNGRVKKLLKKNFDENEIIDYLEKIISNTTFINVFTNTKYCRDVKDNMIINLAIDSDADIIITGDKDLLILNKKFNFKILNPNQFINL